LTVSTSSFISQSIEDTLDRGREIGRRIRAPLLIALAGELGGGKTTLTKGIVAGMGVAKEDDVTSPTFTLIHSYHNGTRVYHVDLYRVRDFQDFETLGIEDIFLEPAVLIIEWADKINLRTEWPRVDIHLAHMDENRRQIEIRDPSDALGTQAAGAPEAARRQAVS
jgi:tRNA threonylcarbamoyladenosine biosynthesis protein TsaE